ncbi:cation diffusion facilitator family transporter [soil metagenome]
MAAGIMGHSSALVADGVESLADAAGSLVTLQGVRVGRRPADANHPYGHGKAEAVAALIVCVLLVVAAGFIAVEAIRELIIPHAAPAAWTLIVVVIVIVAKESLHRFMHSRASAEASVALEAEAWHHRADALTSVAALIGIAAAVYGPRLTGWMWLVGADEVAALVASGVILIVAWRISAPPLHELLDEMPAELVAEVRDIAAAVPGVAAVEKVLARKSGRGYLVDMHVHVAGNLPLRAAHALGGLVRATVKAQHPRVRDVLIHLEPAEEN